MAVPAVFLDRDDTLIACNGLPPAPPPAAPGDLTDPGLVRLLPTVREACAAMYYAGFRLVVVSNQGGVARGALPIAGVEQVNARVRDLLHPFVTAFYFCPFHPRPFGADRAGVGPWARAHGWQKPGPGMILAAAEELGLDLSRSWMIGDAERDVAAGVAAGLAPARCLRIGAGTALPTLGHAARAVLGS